MTGLTTHGCGKSWKQRGNRTGHCGGCHETFEGISLFDAHLVHESDGTITHLDPGEMTFNKRPLEFDGSFGDGSWRRTDLTNSAFKTSPTSGRVAGADPVGEPAERQNRDAGEAVLS